MKILITLCVILISINCFAQYDTIRVQYATKNEIDSFKNGYYIYSDSLNFITSEGKYISNEAEGKWKYFYPQSTQLWYKKNFINGIPHGNPSSYYLSGELKRTEEYEEGEVVYGQCFDLQGNEIEHTPFAKMPIYIGSVSQHLINNLRYPDYAKDNNIMGKVTIRFVVNEDGFLSDAKVLKGIGGGCDQEAIRVINLMKRWKPGIKDDVPVKVYFNQTITFSLE